MPERKCVRVFPWEQHNDDDFLRNLISWEPSWHVGELVVLFYYKLGGLHACKVHRIEKVKRHCFLALRQLVQKILYLDEQTFIHE